MAGIRVEGGEFQRRELEDLRASARLAIRRVEGRCELRPEQAWCLALLSLAIVAIVAIGVRRFLSVRRVDRRAT